RADHLGVAAMADEDDPAAALVMDLRLAMHLGDERAGGVDGEEIARARLLLHRLRDAVRGEDHRMRARRRLAELLDEHSALRLEGVDDEPVVHDLAARIGPRATGALSTGSGRSRSFQRASWESGGRESSWGRRPRRTARPEGAL